MNRVEKLQETKEKLKSEFVGLDEIIDKVIDSVTPWYLTPEVLERPVVVSLWGLTGTGKTSLIRKLTKYLGLSDKTLLFDCGEQGGNDKALFSEKLDEMFDSSQIQDDDARYTQEEIERLGVKADPADTRIDNPIDVTFIFDEFQYLKTKTSTGSEESRPEARAIWSLMDSGLVDINTYDYQLNTLLHYFDDLETFNKAHPEIKIKNGRYLKEYTEYLKENSIYYRWSEDYSDTGEKGFRLIKKDEFLILVKKLNFYQSGLGFEVGDKIMTFTLLNDYVEYLRKYIHLISRPKILNCTKSLIFVLGNLDEAFDLTGKDFDPDVDADVYHEITSRVNCMNIKTALRTRFRDEQISRLGNNIIIYPSLRRCDFEEIINRELTRIKKKFEENHDVEINFSENLKKLIYSDGCFPIQGVRPIFSTINYLVSPMLSLILTSSIKESALIDVDNDTNFNSSQVKLVVLQGDSKIGEKTVQLNLGALRSPDRCKKLGLQAVHEASHAVLYNLLTGENPSAIIASNIFGSGGYMMNEVDPDSSVTSIRELRNTVIISLAGYYGERAFFDEDLCSLGASSDIESVWKNLRDAFYTSGLYIPMNFTESNVSAENHGLPFGFPVQDKKDVNTKLLMFFEDCCERTKKYIQSEMSLIAKISEYLVENRSMGTEVFLGFVKEYGKTFDSIERPEENYYTKKIKEWIQEK